MKTKKLLPLLAVLAAATAALVWRFGLAKPDSQNSRIRVSGNIEVTDAQVAFKIPGRVEQRPVDEGIKVEEGQVVALLDTSDLAHDVELRQAELAAAQAFLDELLAGSRPEEIAAAKANMDRAAAFLAELRAGSRPQEIAVAEALLASAMVEKSRLETELGRAAQLREKGANSQEGYDRAKAAEDVAAAKVREATERLDLAKEGPRREQIEQAQAAFDQMKAQYDLVKAGPRKEAIEQARAKVQQAKAALALAETRLGYATLRAPMPGIVLSKNIEPGEYVAAGTPVVTLANLKDIWLRAYINTVDLTRVKVGQRALVTTDAGETYEGRVSFISSEAEFTPKTVQTQEERLKLVFRIKIDISNPNMELKPGMPADAEILLGSAETGNRNVE